MIIKKVDMVMSAVSSAQYPNEGLPQIAFVGRSNVGKSSLINTLLNRRKIARVSQTPGKTRTINFYEVNEAFYFVDLPGYGYAKLSKEEKSSWGRVMDEFFVYARDLRHVFILVDIRHEPKEDDLRMIAYIRHYDIPVSVIATKSDKLTRNHQNQSMNQIAKSLQISRDSIFPMSSLKKNGQEAIWEHIESNILDEEEQGVL